MKFTLLFSILLASRVMGADTTMTGPVCLYHTKVFAGYKCLDACPSNITQELCFNWYTDACMNIKKIMADSSWYAPCKPKGTK